MRLRLAFKLNGEEAELARQLADAAQMPADRIAKLAMQRYMRDVIDRAEQLMLQQQSTAEGLAKGRDEQMMRQQQPSVNEVSSGLQPSSTDPILPAGAVPATPDSVSGEET